MTKEFVASKKLSIIKESNLYKKIFVHLCVHRQFHPATEIATIPKKAKNLMAKKKSFARQKGKDEGSNSDDSKGSKTNHASEDPPVKEENFITSNRICRV